MIARCGTLFVGNQAAMMTVAAVGTFTAIFAATIALRQFDLKKVFAYSTISQLGYMFAGVGVLAPVAGVFHLVTHAFFKALLFLSSGVVMHAMQGELDMRKMSGLKKVLPWTNIFILIGCLALAGFPFFSGFFSKDDIISAVFRHSAILGSVLLLAAFLTAYYTFRLYFQVFQGPLVIPEPPPQEHHDDHGHGTDHSHGHGEEHHHNHEPFIMMFPLSLFAGYLNWPSDQLGEFLGHSPSLSASYELAVQTYGNDNKIVDRESMGQPAEGAEQKSAFPVSGLMMLSGLISAAGIVLAYWLHLANRAAGDRLAEELGPITRLLEAKYWVDEFYQWAIVDNLRRLGNIFFIIDQYIVDGLVTTIGLIPQLGGFAMKLSTQRGYLQGYAAAMLLGIAAILFLMFI
jgi:NADH-quinone oxidoreductase subunit L